MIDRLVILWRVLKSAWTSKTAFCLWVFLQVLWGSERFKIVHAYQSQPFPYQGPMQIYRDWQAIDRNNSYNVSYTANTFLLNHVGSSWEELKRPSQKAWLAVGLCVTSLLVVILLIELFRYRLVQKHILRENENRFHALTYLGADLFWELDKNLRVAYLSGDFQSLQRENLEGKALDQVLASLPGLDADWTDFNEQLTQHKPLKNFILQLQTSHTTVRIFKLDAQPLFDKNHHFQGYHGLQREVTEEYNLTQTIAYQATYDPLTGLINRNEFDTRLRQAIKRARDRDIQSVLGYLDLDQFKIVNDTAGHLIGDQLLTELAQVLQQNIRSSDSLGRLGGDEFGLLLEGCSLEQGQKLSQTLVDNVKNYQFTWRGRQFQVGVSVGLVPIEGDTSTVVELLSRADLACYKAKDLGRGRVYLAEQNDTELDRQHLELIHIANIPQALEEKRFHLMAQPIISLSEESYQHVEILLRLTDENGKSVAPNLFIPMAERYGMIGLIDRWVVKTVLTNYHHYYPEAKTIVAINLSGSSLSDERFTEFVTQLLQQSAMPAKRLCFEITETTTISRLDQAIKFITTLRQLGVSFALDDFGSGVSSFGYLRTLPVDYLKIDGDLIRNIVEEEYVRTIVDMVNQVATMMGMKAIAESVENDEILDCLQTLNVPYGQGYGIGKPKPLPRVNN